MMLNIIFFMLVSLPSNCKEIEWHIERDICITQYMDDTLLEMLIIDLKIHAACDIFEEWTFTAEWIEGETYE